MCLGAAVAFGACWDTRCPGSGFQKPARAVAAGAPGLPGCQPGVSPLMPLSPAGAPFFLWEGRGFWSQGGSVDVRAWVVPSSEHPRALPPADPHRL